MASTSLQLAGLASGFDWKSFVDTIMTTEHAPADQLAATKTKNLSKISAFDTLASKITDLQTSAKALGAAGLFSGRTAASQTANSAWITSAASDTATGNYAIAVSQLATTTKRTGTSDIGAGLATTNDVTGVTLASMATAVAPTAGVFTVNGKQVTIALTDSLQDVFTKISTATSGAVTGAYDSTTDKITLSTVAPATVTLGAANDTSNFLQVTKLANNGGSSITSGSALGSVSLTATLANARLRTPITAVDGSGNGSFTLNGVSINYNVNTDSLNSVISKINGSSAGVSASYDAANDRMVLTNKSTGNLGINFTESAGGLLAASGISGGTTAFGNDAQFTINGGPTLTSSSNTLDSTAHGIAGLSVTVNSQTTETIAVSNNTSTMRSSIEDFIKKFNAVQSYISDQTKITSSNGKVTTALMANNREIQNWASTFRSTAFAAVSGLSGTIQRLDHLGIDFTAGTAQLAIKDGTKLDAALRDHSSDVEAFFKTATTGFSAKIDSFSKTVLGTGTSATGLLNTQKNSLTSANTSIDKQIADIERRLVSERAKMEDGFIAMEKAQSVTQQQQQQLANAFK